jgi:hypothetical protein
LEDSEGKVSSLYEEARMEFGDAFAVTKSYKIIALQFEAFVVVEV